MSVRLLAVGGGGGGGVEEIGFFVNLSICSEVIV